MLVRDWEPLLAGGALPGTTEEAIWGALLEEHEWLFRQMDRRLRRYFSPAFLLFELKTIVLCLRNRGVANKVAIDALLARSLLAESVQNLLREGDDARSAVTALVATIGAAADGFRDVGSAFAKEGLKGFEDSLMRSYLQHAVRERLHPLIRTFFVSFIDLRNAMILYKHLRWEVTGGSPFVSGGSIETARFGAVLADRDKAGFERLVRQVADLSTIPIDVGEAALETVLLRGMTRQLRHMGREDDEVGLILDYVWRIYVQARNLAVLHHGKGIDPAALEKELIL